MAGARPTSFGADGTQKVPVRIVLPSEYARFDVSTVSVFALMKSTALSNFIGAPNVLQFARMSA